MDEIMNASVVPPQLGGKTYNTRMSKSGILDSRKPFNMGAFRIQNGAGAKLIYE